MKIGLYFGSFNPVHIGHMIIANTMATHADLDEVWFVISPQNPFKKKSTLLHEFDRLEMVEKAIYDHPKLRASNIEFDLPQPSYTIDTLTYIQEKHPSHEFVLIMGSDNLTNFSKWKNHEQILEYFEVYIYPRPRVEDTPFHQHPKVKQVNAPLLDISATYIRQCIKDQKDVRYLVDDDVLQIIQRKKFYI